MTGSQDTAGWTLDLRIGWRVVAHKLHYFAGDGSFCGVWGQPKVWGRPRKEVYTTPPEKYREMVCAKCAAAVGTRSALLSIGPEQVNTQTEEK